MTICAPWRECFKSRRRKARRCIINGVSSQREPNVEPEGQSHSLSHQSRHPHAVGRSMGEAETSQGHGELHSCLSPLSSPFQLHRNGSAVNPDEKE